MTSLKMLGAVLTLFLTIGEAAHIADDPHTHSDEHGFVTIDARNYAAATCSAYIAVRR